MQAVLEGLGPASELVAADVGAGTGISARLLGDAGARVIAIEPGASMRAAATSHPRVTWIAGRAEATGLRRTSVDLVLAAQAFHWFRADEALVEFARVLRPAGRLAIMWNRRSQHDPFTAGYRDAIVEVGGEVQAERMPFDPGVVRQSAQFSPLERLSFANAQRLDLDGLIGRSRSASAVPKEGPAADRLRELLEALHARFADADGLVTLVYETELYRASRL